MGDGRGGVADYYDLAPHHPNDVPFYVGRLPSPRARVLELGCGTGRVSIPLAGHCSFLHGVDYSASMLAVCATKLEEARLDSSRIVLSRVDITDFDLGARFDLVIAPFRVVQNLETEAELQGLFDSIRRHLSPSGLCILNAFRPSRDPAGMVASWASESEELAWEVETPDGKVACYDHRLRVTTDPLIVHPNLIYRRFQGEHMVDEAVLKIAMRCFYPTEFVEKIEAAGFTVLAKWGGYTGERYGEGSELVVEFTMDA